jgi:hypothetical protein
VVGSKRFIRLITVGACAVLLCALSPVATASADDPNLVGAFTPHGTLAEHGQGYRTACARLQKEA